LPIGNARVGLTSPNQPLPDASSYPDPFIGSEQSPSGSNGSNASDQMLRQSPNGQSAPLVQPEPRNEFQAVSPEPIMVKGPELQSDTTDTDLQNQSEQLALHDRAPANDAPWQEILPIDARQVDNVQVVSTSPVKRLKAKPVVAQASLEMAVVADTNQSSNGALVDADSDEGWVELPSTRFRKTVRNPVLLKQVIQQDDSGWLEIK